MPRDHGEHLAACRQGSQLFPSLIGMSEIKGEHFSGGLLVIGRSNTSDHIELLSGNGCSRPCKRLGKRRKLGEYEFLPVK